MSGVHQSLKTQAGEIAFRKLAAFGEPEKVLEITRAKIEARRTIFEGLGSRGVALTPFLEIGADIGATTLVLRNEFEGQGFAVDISRDALKVTPEVAERLGYDRLPIRICCDARWLPVVDDAVSFVYCLQTLHHFADPEPVIHEVARVLGPGGHFYFDEEPIRRWLCLNLYRCDRPESLTGFDRWLFRTGLIRYVAEAYIGSLQEVEYGCVENQTVSLGQWERFFSAIGEVETRLSLFTRDAQYLQRAFRRLGVPDTTSLRLLANLFGATLGGLCTSTKSGEPAETKDLTKLVCCPDCKRPLELLHKPSTHFACSRCGAFDVFHGVHVLLRKERSKVLYPKMPESSPETSSKQEFRWKEDGPPATVAKEHRQPTERRSPHPLTKGAVIKSVSLLNRNDESVDSIRSGELTTIRVEIEFKEDVPKPVVGFIIRTIENGTASIVYDTNTMWRAQPTADFHGGDTAVVTYAQQMNLGPGTYYLSTAIASEGAEKFYDWREAVLSFEVEPAPGMQGSVNLNSKIRMELS